jgi:hypothetical protein
VQRLFRLRAFQGNAGHQDQAIGTRHQPHGAINVTADLASVSDQLRQRHVVLQRNQDQSGRFVPKAAAPWNIRPPPPLGHEVREDADMGELLDALNAVDARGAAPDEPKSTVDQAAAAFQSASRRVGEAVDAARQPDMPLDVLARLVRQAPLPSLAIAFVLGVIVARR